MAKETIDKEQLDIVRRMAVMAEYHDADAVSHRERVRSYCLVLAGCLGLSAQQAELISTASLLHDVGKIGLPDAVANKTGDLTPYEWDVMKRHTSLGADLLHGSTSSVLQTAETIALTHHERWDGSGYPSGLKGEEIPLSSRICSLADVFDALTTRRSYKHEVSFDDAVSLIKEASGQLFDPRVVNAFTSSQSEIFKIWSSTQLK